MSAQKHKIWLKSSSATFFLADLQWQENLQQTQLILAAY